MTGEGMTPEEAWAFEEANGIPHLPPEPPPSADPERVTHAEAEAGGDHIVSVMNVVARTETIFGDHERAAAIRVAGEQFALLMRVVITTARGGTVSPEVWDAIKRKGDELSRRAKRIAADEEGE